jgi:hypothetical protein
MKKITILTLALFGVFSLSSCSEENFTPSPNVAVAPYTHATSSATTIQTEPYTPTVSQDSFDFQSVFDSPDDSCWMIWTSMATVSAFRGSWCTVWQANSVLQERAWAAEYEERLAMTFDEVFSEWFLDTSFDYVCLFSDDLGESLNAYREVQRATRCAEDLFFESAHWDVWTHANQPVFIELIHRFNITEDEFIRANNRAHRLHPQPVRNHLNHSNVFLPEEIDLLFSGDTVAIMQAALNPWSIMVEDRVYSAQWLLDNPPDVWVAEGISEREVSRVFDVFRVALDDEQVVSFETELDVFRREHATE